MPPNLLSVIFRGHDTMEKLHCNVFDVYDDRATERLSLQKRELHDGGMTYQTLISITAILSDLNTVAVAGVLYNDSATWEVYQDSCIASFAIPGWNLLTHMNFLFSRLDDAVQVVGGKSISKGPGTIGEFVRRLASGESEAVEAVGRVREGQEMQKGGQRKEVVLG